MAIGGGSEGPLSATAGRCEFGPVYSAVNAPSPLLILVPKDPRETAQRRLYEGVNAPSKVIPPTPATGLGEGGVTGVEPFFGGEILAFASISAPWNSKP